jgi:ADP-ribose pyrophosphatase YjhB (NUDIX family)
VNFCSNCGSNKIEFTVPDGDNRQRYVCLNCEIIHYKNPNIVTGAIPVWDNKILLAKRSIEPRKGFWNLPCGFLELDETVEEGAIREVKEETDVDVELQHLHTVYNLPHANQVYMIFVAKMLHNNFKKTTESSDVKLFTLEEIPWKEIAFSSNSFALEAYIEDLKTGFKAVHLGTFRKHLS